MAACQWHAAQTMSATADCDTGSSDASSSPLFDFHNQTECDAHTIVFDINSSGSSEDLASDADAESLQPRQKRPRGTKMAQGSAEHLHQIDQQAYHDSLVTPAEFGTWPESILYKCLFTGGHGHRFLTCVISMLEDGVVFQSMFTGRQGPEVCLRMCEVLLSKVCGLKPGWLLEWSTCEKSRSMRKVIEKSAHPP